MQINHNAPVKQQRQIQIQASADQVWAVLVDVNHWADWNRKIRKAKLEGPPRVGGQFSWSANGVKIRSLFHTMEQAKMLGWTGKTFGATAIHNWYLEEIQQSVTLVRVEESMQGWLVALFKNKMNQTLGKDMEFWLQQLKAECER